MREVKLQNEFHAVERSVAEFKRVAKAYETALATLIAFDIDPDSIPQ